MDIFYFALITYNQENFVQETLNSFKYQIQNYGRNYSFNLIIVDDASDDNTIQVIKNWIDKNNRLFHEVIWQLNGVNRGVVKNYQFIIDKIPINCHFKLLAGDDVLSHLNMFSSYEKLNDTMLITHVRLLLKNGVVSYDDDQLLAFYDHLLHATSKKCRLVRMRRGGYLHTPSTIYTKKLYLSAGCSEYNSNFCLFEDDPSWYAMIKNTNDLDIYFVKKPIVLYRISDFAISNGKGEMHKKFLDELYRLVGIYYKDSSGLERLYHWARLHNEIPKIIRYSTYVDYFRKIYLRIKYSNDKSYKKFKRDIDVIVEQEQKYYDVYIKKTA